VIEFLLQEFFDFINSADYVDFEEATRYRCAPAAPCQPEGICTDMNSLSRSIQAITKSPLLWGLLGSAGFYALIHAGPLHIEFFQRYFTHHPVEYMETVLFSIGLAALLIKAFDTVAQRASLSESLLGSVPRTANPVEECNALVAR
jgi:hypothetical protein